MGNKHNKSLPSNAHITFSNNNNIDDVEDYIVEMYIKSKDVGKTPVVPETEEQKELRKRIYCFIAQNCDVIAHVVHLSFCSSGAALVRIESSLNLSEMQDQLLEMIGSNVPMYISLPICIPCTYSVYIMDMVQHYCDHNGYLMRDCFRYDQMLVKGLNLKCSLSGTDRFFIHFIYYLACNIDIDGFSAIWNSIYLQLNKFISAVDYTRNQEANYWACLLNSLFSDEESCTLAEEHFIGLILRYDLDLIVELSELFITSVYEQGLFTTNSKALFAAIRVSEMSLIELLVEGCKLNVNTLDQHHLSPKMLSRVRKEREISNYLAQNGAIESDCGIYKLYFPDVWAEIARYLGILDLCNLGIVSHMILSLTNSQTNWNCVLFNSLKMKHIFPRRLQLVINKSPVPLTSAHFKFIYLLTRSGIPCAFISTSDLIKFTENRQATELDQLHPMYPMLICRLKLRFEVYHGKYGYHIVFPEYNLLCKLKYTKTQEDSMDMGNNICEKLDEYYSSFYHRMWSV